MFNFKSQLFKFLLHKQIYGLLIFFTFINTINSQFQINGNASQIDCKCYQLTPNSAGQVGSVWNIYQIDLNQPFDFNFDVFLGCNNSSVWTGADGIVFGLQPLNTNIGTAGGGMGMGGIAPSLGVYIDTYQNTAHNDILNDHISINSNGDFNHSSANNLSGPYDLGEIEDCAYHTLRVVWNPSITTYQVYFDGVLALTYFGDIINTIFGGNPTVFWGFTGSTGQAFNEQRFCIDVPDITIDVSNLSILDEHCGQSDGSITGITYTGGLSPVTFDWNGSTTLNLDTSNLTAGTYQLTITDGLGCNEIAGPYTINNIPSPTIDTNSMLVVDESCNQSDGSITGITVSGGVSPYIYTWNGATTTLIDQSNLSSGTYQLIVNDSYGCQDSINVNIDSIPGPEIDTSLLSIYNEDCGQSNGYINGLSINNGTTPLTYFWNNNVVTSIDTNDLSLGSYTFTVLDGNGCTDSASFTIDDINYHTAEFDYNPSNPLAESSVSFNDLSIDTSVYWLWDFGDGTTDTSQNPIFSYEFPGDYTVCLTSINNFNCSDTYCLDITIEAIELIIPNVFTPNNDRINDYFKISGINDQFELSILNRWGETIFHSFPYKNNWDGRTSAGIELPSGTYLYVLTNHLVNENYSGTFQIQR